jgi:hypothetical protein
MEKAMIFVLLIASLAATALAAWQENGTAICTAANSQYSPVMVADWAGGAIIAWQDYRSGTSTDIYIQRVDGSGTVLWPADGVAMCNTSGNQGNLKIIADGLSGAIVAWMDNRSGVNNIYAQRVNSQGTAQWAANGVAAMPSPASQLYPSLVADGAGGAIIAWQDSSNGNWDIGAQRINGTVQWGVHAHGVCTEAHTQQSPVIARAGNGAIIAWTDRRNGYCDIYAQRVDSSGNMQWTVNGVVISNAADDQYAPVITPDGAGGAIIVWMDTRSGNNNIDLYAQRVDNNGTVQWTAGGVAFCDTAGQQIFPKIMSDGAGGAIVAWQDTRNGEYDIYAQRINGSGIAQWAAGGQAVCTAAGTQKNHTIASGGVGAAVIAWEDSCNGNWDVYVQLVDSSGAVPWTVNGAAICDTAGDQGSPAIVTDGLGGAIVAWQDYRSGNWDIYASRAVSNQGVSGEQGRAIPPAAVRCSCFPNPSRGAAIIRYQLPAASEARLDIYTIAGQLVSSYHEGRRPAGRHQVAWGASLPNGVYLCRLTTGFGTVTRKAVVLK